jgi:hypothetical protein
MPKPDFDVTWIPRIGEEATAIARTARIIASITGPLMFVGAFAASFLLGSGTTIGVLLGLVAVGLDVGLLVNLVRIRLRLAAAMSGWLAVPVTWSQMPKMRVKDFDAWCAGRGHQPTPHTQP